MNNKAYLQTENVKDLHEVINWLNERYKLGSRSFSIVENSGNNYEINVNDKSDLIPYGIFEVGSYIGQKWMRKNYRLELGNWQESINKTLFKDEYYPKYEKVNLSLNNKEINEFKVRNAIGITSSLDTLKPFLSQEDYSRIIKFSEFNQIPNIKSFLYTSKEGLNINYHIVNDKLLIFGVKSDYSKEEFEIKLISAFEIKKTNYDF